MKLTSYKTVINSIFHRVILADGRAMPIFGLGCWELSPEEAYDSVRFAIKAGYRLFDTAAMYRNEKTVGKALKESGLHRDDYFVVTKLDPQKHGYSNAKLNLKESIKRLGVDYVDLFLIHTPRPGKNIETWKAFVDLKTDGFTRSIGVSNYNVQHLEGLLASGMEPPTVNQIEFHPWYQQKQVFDYCTKHNISLMGFCPLARTRLFNEDNNAILERLNKKYNKTKPQLILRWALQHGVITIPRSSKCERIEENGDLFDFSLTEDDVKMMDTLDSKNHISMSTTFMQEPWVG